MLLSHIDICAFRGVKIPVGSKDWFLIVLLCKAHLFQTLQLRRT